MPTTWVITASTVKNRASWFSGQKTIAAAGTGSVITSQAIPDGFSLVVKAKAGNTGNMEIGHSEVVAEGGTGIILQPNEAIKLAVTNANLVWVDAVTNGDGIEYWVET